MGESLSNVRQWWDKLASIGSSYGYLPNASKTCLVVKEDKLYLATNIFHGTDIAITTNWRRHLRAAIDTRTFAEEYVIQKAIEWAKEFERLSSIVISHTAFTHGIVSKWTYLCRNIPDIADLLMPLQITIRYKFLPVITGQPAISDADRNFLALPVCLGGLSILDLAGLTAFIYKSSQEVTKHLTALILQNNTTSPPNTRARQQRSKAEARKTRQRANKSQLTT